MLAFGRHHDQVAGHGRGFCQNGRDHVAIHDSALPCHSIAGRWFQARHAGAIAYMQQGGRALKSKQFQKGRRYFQCRCWTRLSCDREKDASAKTGHPLLSSTNPYVCWGTNRARNACLPGQRDRTPHAQASACAPGAGLWPARSGPPGAHPVSRGKRQRGPCPSRSVSGRPSQYQRPLPKGRAQAGGPNGAGCPEHQGIRPSSLAPLPVSHAAVSTSPSLQVRSSTHAGTLYGWLRRDPLGAVFGGRAGPCSQDHGSWGTTFVSSFHMFLNRKISLNLQPRSPNG